MSRNWNMKKLTLLVGNIILDANGSLTSTTPSAVVVGTATPAGSTNADAGAVPSNSLVTVTGADGTKGVILPALAGGQTIRIKNVTAAILKVYPPSGAQINALTATTGGYSQAASTFGEYIYTSATQVYTLPLVIS